MRQDQISSGQRSSFSQHSGIAVEGRISGFAYLMWLLSMLVCMLAIVVTFAYFDVPIARRFYGVLATASLTKGFSSTVLLGAEAAVALALVMLRVMRGRLSPFRVATLLACLTSICTYAINEVSLKSFFGVPNPAAVLHGTQHTLHLLSGSSGSSFPSGHMVLAGAFAGVFMQLYRRSILPLAALLLIAAVLLIVGDLHFVSDVIAGTSVGVSAGLLAGTAWLAHSS